SGGALSLALQIDGPPAFSQWLEARRSEAGRNPLDGRVLTEMRPIQVTDFQLEYPHERIPRDWFRTVLLVPMLRAGEVIGTICLYRYEAMLTKATDSGSNTTESAVTMAPGYVQAQHSLIRWSTKLATGARPHPFSEHEITLVQTFADQAALAIENVRLVSETQEKSGMLEIANHELAAASHHKSEFLANMSHELRTPLNAIIGFSDVLEDRMFGELNERQTDYVKDISGSGRHLLDLINEILDLSKVEAGKMDLEPSEFRLADTISGALLLVRERAVRHGIQLSTDVPDDVGMLEADERKLRQVLLNLLSNAVKFTPDGGRIAVTVRRVDPEIRISVRDTGIGIAPEDQPKIFQEFQQVGRPTDRSREGTGLGLTLAKRFVELQGGRIWFESEVGKGTTFTFTLPVRRTAALPA
ncbi:MAG TPA: GAF domain-containing sensor histidine kinase, partial [Methylomirabilota bacterium]|nr:GAF domain-containing sensor histidine kinase [Methylomirabilota bacterium]